MAMTEHAGLTHFQDRKDLLLTAKQILKDYAENRHIYNEEKPTESLRDHVRKMVINLLMENREKEKKKAKNTAQQKTIVDSLGVKQPKI